MNQLSDYHRERVQAVLAVSPLVPVIAIKTRTMPSRCAVRW